MCVCVLTFEGAGAAAVFSISPPLWQQREKLFQWKWTTCLHVVFLDIIVAAKTALATWLFPDTCVLYKAKPTIRIPTGARNALKHLIVRSEVLLLTYLGEIITFFEPSNVPVLRRSAYLQGNRFQRTLVFFTH